MSIIQRMEKSTRGRRSGSSTTREEILHAARERFAAHGYDRTRIRDVAEDAGVDAALVHYFFKTKDGLFGAAMALPFSPAELLGRAVAQGPDGVGERILRSLLAVWDAHRGALVGLVHSATAHEGAAASVREFVTREMVGRLSLVARDDDPALRANLAASQIVGLIVARYVIGLEPLASLGHDEVVAQVAPTLQRYLQGDL
jgi:AcrR family transcriptional regulator